MRRDRSDTRGVRHALTDDGGDHGADVLAEVDAVHLCSRQGRGHDVRVEVAEVPQRRTLLENVGDLPDHARLAEGHDDPVEGAVLGDRRAEEDLKGRAVRDGFGL